MAGKPVSKLKSTKKPEVAAKAGKGNKVAKEPKAKKEKASTKVPGLSVGLKSGLGVTATWNKIFKENIDNKKTDAKLQEIMSAEFPQRDYFQPIARCRSWFNSGKYGFGYGPDEKIDRDDARRSVEYDEKGNVIKRANPFAKKGESEAAPAKAAKKKVVKKVAKKTPAAE